MSCSAAAFAAEIWTTPPGGGTTATGEGTSGARPSWPGGGPAGGGTAPGGGCPPGGRPVVGSTGASAVAAAPAPSPNRLFSAPATVGSKAILSLYSIATRIRRGYVDAASPRPGEAYTGSTYRSPPWPMGSV